MRVAMYYSNRDIRLQELPKPIPGKGEILVRVEASGICGSDVMEWYRIDRVPLVLGHEIAGVIEETGEGVRGYRHGQRVAVSHHVPCGKCYYCRRGQETVCDTLRRTNFYPGGFSEFVRVPQVNVAAGGVYALPKSVSFEEATFIEPLACVLRAQRVAGVSRGSSVLVVGSGIAGLLHIHLARVKGAASVVATDISDFRLEAAKRFGADRAFHARDYKPEYLLQLNNGKLAEVVVVCTGAPAAILQALESVERNGTVLFFAATDKDATVPFPLNSVFWRTERKLVSSYAASPADHREALELIRRKKVRLADMVTHRLPLAETGEGFRLVAEAKESIKVIIEPQR